jgi:hypothetical protein
MIAFSWYICIQSMGIRKIRIEYITMVTLAMVIVRALTMRITHSSRLRPKAMKCRSIY